MHLPRPCPHCSATMQLVTFSRGPRANPLELQRCPDCFGLWFDAGELEEALGERLTPEPLEPEVDRRCANCQTPMATVLLPHGVPAERCSHCSGIYLDAGELHQLGGREPPLPMHALQRLAAPADPATTAAVWFECARCQRPVHRGEKSAGTALGLVCDGCTPQVAMIPRVPSVFDRPHQVESATDGTTLVTLLLSLFDG